MSSGGGSGSGSKLVATLSTAVQAARQSTLQNSITWEQELDFELLLSQLPRAARLVVSLLARAEQGEQGRDRFTELGWAALQLFSHDRYLAQVAGISGNIVDVQVLCTRDHSCYRCGR